MHIDRIASVFLAKPLLASGVLRSKPGIPILMYHSVSDEPETGVSPYYRVVTPRSRFRQQLRWLQESGFEVIDLVEALSRLNNGTEVQRPSVVLTFDDGFEDFRTGAWPVLVEFGATATVFLPTAYIGKNGTTRKSFKGRPCLTWTEVRELHASGVSFGAHTVNHPVLHGLSWEDVTREIGESRARIEDELQQRVGTFAYPYAFPQEDRPFVTRLRQQLLTLGITCAVTTVVGRAMPGQDALCLKRLPVNGADDTRLFSSKLSGAYDWVGNVQGFFRHTKMQLRINA